MNWIVLFLTCLERIFPSLLFYDRLALFEEHGAAIVRLLELNCLFFGRDGDWSFWLMLLHRNLTLKLFLSPYSRSLYAGQHMFSLAVIELLAWHESLLRSYPSNWIDARRMTIFDDFILVLISSPACMSTKHELIFTIFSLLMVQRAHFWFLNAIFCIGIVSHRIDWAYG